MAAADRVEQTAEQLDDLQVQQHDSHEFRVARAEQLANDHFEPDVAEAAMINDLSFGTPASRAATAAEPGRRKARSTRTANRGTIRERSTSGR